MSDSALNWLNGLLWCRDPLRAKLTDSPDSGEEGVFVGASNPDEF